MAPAVLLLVVGQSLEQIGTVVRIHFGHDCRESCRGRQPSGFLLCTRGWTPGQAVSVASTTLAAVLLVAMSD